MVERIIDVSDDEVVLSIPRFSHLAGSLSNFHLLKREGDALRKKIIVESVDDRVVELAEMSGLTASNPFFAKNKRQFSDILAPGKAEKENKKRRGSALLARDNAEFNFEEADHTGETHFNTGEPVKPKARSWSWPKISWPAISWPRFRGGRRRLLRWSGAVILLAIILFVALKVLPKVTVTLVMQTKEWSYHDSITTEKSAALDIAKMTIPNQIFSQKKNVQLRFPATGKRQVEKKASGVVKIFNAYSSDPQPLVEQTRFMAPDGKLFRLSKSIVIPGAKITEGKIVPFGIDALVTADQPGPDYNIGPVKLFTIPGFKGTPKYQAFYAESNTDMAGGFIGQIAYPLPADIQKAKVTIETTLNDALKTSLATQIPKEFKLLDGATRYAVAQQKIDSEADANGTFGIFTEAQITAIGFREADLQNLLVGRAEHDNAGLMEIRSSTLEYGLPRVDFDRGLLAFPVNFKEVLAKKVDVPALQNSLLGKSELELKAQIFALDGLQSAKVSLWPIWVKRVPNSVDKVKIIVE